MEILEFLENESEWENNIGVLQAFRHASKSTIVSAFIVWKLVTDPTLVFLVRSADDDTTQSMVEDCKSIINMHPYAAHLKGKEGTWSARHFSVRGSTDGRNKSVAARGIMSNVTGRRADYIIFDDVEVPKNAATEELRTKLRRNIAESHHLLKPNGKKLFVGTPHAHDSIYPETVARGASSLLIPALKNSKGEFPFITGDITWGELWDEKSMFEKQLNCTSINEFYSQYMLIAKPIDDSIFDPTRIQTYKDEPVVYTANKQTTMTIAGRMVVSVACFWDPALSKSTRDSSVMAIVFGLSTGEIYIHRVIELKGDADRQCDQVKEMLVRYSIPLIRIETNGLGATLPDLLLKRVRGMGIGVDGKQTTERKIDNVIKAYEVPISANYLYCHVSVMNTKFVTQLRDFNPRNHKGHDDFIDAPAKAIHMLPSRYGKGIENDKGTFQAFRRFDKPITMKRKKVSFSI
jgi:hypothetical protein